MPQSRAWENPGRETDSTVIEPGLKGLNAYLPLNIAEQPKSGTAHHHGPCHLISSVRLYPCFPLNTGYCVASSAFHSVKGSFIPAPPVPGMLHRKRRGCRDSMNTALPHAPRGFHCFLPCCASWVVLDWNIQKPFNSIPAHQGMKATTLCLHGLQYLLLRICCCCCFCNLSGRKREERSKFSRWRNKSNSLELERDSQYTTSSQILTR